MSWTQQDTSFKKLQSKRITTSTGKGINEEKGASTLELYLPDIKTEIIPGTPPGVSTAVLSYTGGTGQTLAVDTSVPGNLTWFATSGFGNTTVANDGTESSENARLMSWISDKYDAFGTVSGAGYEIKLYDRNSNLITKTDPSDWLFDYQTGILTFNNASTAYGTVSTSGPYRIVGYRYIGSKGIISASYGGLGYTTYTKGDLLVGAGSTFIKLNVGSNNYVLSADSSTPSGLNWVVNSGSGSGVSVINGLSATTQFFAVGSSGTEFNISSSGSTHTFNIPIAGTGSTGLITNLAQTIAGSKTFTSAILGDLTGTATTATYAYQSGYAITSGIATTSNYAYQSGYAVTSGLATTSEYSYQSGYAITSGLATTATYAYQSGYGITSGFATTAGLATTSSYSYQSGYAVTSGFATTAGLATTATYAYQSGYAVTSGLATTATYAYQSGYAVTSGFATTAGLATTATYAQQSGYAITSGLATTATYAYQSGYAVTSGLATTSSNVNVVNSTANVNHSLLFTPSNGTISGAALSSNSTVSYNPSTFILSTPGLAVTSSAASTSFSTGALVVTGGVGIGGSLFVNGDLTINGTTTTINSVTLTVDDKNIELGSVSSPSDVTAEAGGITLKGTTDKFINWYTGTGWSSNQDWNLASGLVYKINNTAVLSASSLGTGVTNSSLTAVGTITTGTWAGSLITALYGGTGYSSYTKGDVLVGVGNTFVKLGVGTDNFVLTADTASPSGIKWSSVAGLSITSVNGLTASAQFFSTGTSGTGFNISSSGSTHTFNIPIAGTGATGLVSTLAQSFAGTKTFTGDVVVSSTTGSTAFNTGSLTVYGGLGVSGQLSFNQAALGYTGASNPSVAFIGSTTAAPITLTVLSDNSLLWEGTSGKLFGINNNLSSGWIFNVGDISGLPIIRANADGTIAMAEFTANVGIGLSNPSYKLHVVGDTNLSSSYVYRINGTSVLSASSLGTGVTNSSLTAVGTITTGTWAATAITALYGGTGLVPSFTVGDILYANTSSTWGRLPANSNSGYVLTSAGSGATPTYVAPSTLSVGFATTAGFATTSSYSYQSGYAVTSGLATTSSYAYQSGYAITSGLATTASYAHQSGYAITSGFATTAGLATTATYAHQSGYAITSGSSGFATTSTYSHQSGYAITSGSSGTASTATYAHQSGYATTSGLATTANYSHQSGYAITSGNAAFASTATYAYQSGYAITAGLATTATYSHQSGYATTSGLATTATYAHESGYAITAGFATTASYSYQSGYGLTSGFATTATNLNVVASSTNATHYLLFSPVNGGSGVAVSSDAGLFFNPGSNTLTTTTFSAGSAVNSSTASITGSTASTSPTTGALVVTGGVGIGGSLFVGGDLTINGTTTTINSVTLTVDDKNIELGSVSSPSDVTAEGGGITLKGATDKFLNWYSGTGWSSSESFNLASGNAYKINNTTVLSASSLGTGVTNSSLTALGTITTGVWAGTAITGLYGGTGYTTYTKGDLLVGAGSTFIKLAVGSDNFVLTASSFSAIGLSWLPTAATGITSLNGLSSSVQFFSIGYSGTAPSFSSSGSTHTLNIPIAGTGVTGLITGIAQTIAGQKTFTSAIIGDLTGTATTAGFATTANYSLQSGYAITAGLATTATYSYQSGYAITSGLATTSTYAYQSGYAITSGFATTSANINVVNAVTNSAHPLHFSPVATGSGVAVSSNTAFSFNPSTLILSTSGLAVTASTVSTSSSTGALVVTGGVGIGGSVYTATDLNVGNSTTGRLYFSQATLGSAGTTVIPSMAFIGATNSPITLSVLADNSLSFDGSSGQLFSINNNLSTGYIFAVNDISGLPLLRANADGTVTMGEFAGNIGIGLSNPSYKLHVAGDTNLSSGYVYRINGTSVLSASSLGTGVTNSSLTSVGIINLGTWAGSTITALYGGTGYSSYTKGDILVGSGTSFIKLGVGTDNYILSASSSSATGLTWVANTGGGGAGTVYNGSLNAIPYYPAAGTAITGSINFTNTGTGISIAYSTASINTVTGAFTVSGGVGIGGSLYTSSSYADSISGVVINNGVITTGTWAGSLITGLYGGTGYSAYTKGDILVGAGSTFIKVGSGSTNYILSSSSIYPAGVGWTWVSAVGVGTNPPNDTHDSDLWWNSDDGSLNFYYNDGDTSQWVEIAGGSGIDLSQPVHITSGVASTNTVTGALIVDGGVGVGGMLNATSVRINGGFDLLDSSLITSTSSANQVGFAVSSADYRTLKFIVSVDSGSDYQSDEILMMHNGSTVFMTEYAQLLSGSGTTITTYDGDISSGNLRLLVSPLNSVTNYSISCIGLRV